MDINELFWNAPVDELCKGYHFDTQSDAYICLICGQSYIEGMIYSVDDLLLTARKRMEMHILSDHSSMFDYLLNMDKKYTGLTDHQKKLLGYFQKGYTDKEIIALEGEGSTSTIRNHRFKLKEKEKQAKIYLALMNLLDKKSTPSEKLVSFHRSAKMVDERYAITEDEKSKILHAYFDESMSRLSEFPGKEKRKLVILQYICERFQPNTLYTEREINTILMKIYDDYVTLRRYLIEYGFMDRTRDGSAYWVKL